MDIETRLDRLALRRTDPNILEINAKSYEGYRSLDIPKAIKYIIGSMQPIDERYTRRTIEQGERVRKQLESNLPPGVAYRFQGSVMTDTHIKFHSDIDLLVFNQKFRFVKEPLEAKPLYDGDSAQDMRDLRSATTSVIQSEFPKVTVDDSNSTAIKLSGGSLTRDVDVVPAAWMDTLEYINSMDETHRGVQVFNKKDGSFQLNYPFKNKAEIQSKDRRCSGGMRKAARFMKTIKADSEQESLRSYDITALAWNMPDEVLSYGMPWDLKIFFGCRDFLRRVVSDSEFRNGLWVPDGSRRIFADGHATEQGAMALLTDIEELAAEVSIEVEAVAHFELKAGASGLPVHYGEIRDHNPFSLLSA